MKITKEEVDIIGAHRAEKAKAGKDFGRHEAKIGQVVVVTDERGTLFDCKSSLPTLIKHLMKTVELTKQAIGERGDTESKAELNSALIAIATDLD